MEITFSSAQITDYVSQSVRPLISKGTQCYLITSRYCSRLMIFSSYWVDYSAIHVFYILQTCFLTIQNKILFVCSVDAIFPTVSLNFAGGASMNLKPEDYLLQQNSIVRCQP